MPYTFAVTLTIAAFFFLICRRFVFSLYAAGALVLLLASVSAVKHRLKGFALHFFDFVFTGLDTSAVSFLAQHYSAILFAALLILTLVLVVLAFVYSKEKPLKLHWGLRSGALAAGIALSVALFPPPRPREPAYLPYIDGYNASAFFISLGDISWPLGSVELGKRLAATQSVDEALEATPECGPARDMPDVAMILMESTTNPAIFPQLSTPAALQASFRSFDGKERALYVENYGGGTWISNFSAMTGLSSTDFGWQASYLTHFMEGRIRGSLPEVLAACGYRTVTVMPMRSSFVNEGPFLQSIGFQEIHDADTMGLEPTATSDRPYFDYAQKLVAEHRATDGRPLFLAMQTLVAHGPYDTPLVPESEVPATRFAEDAGANEYMRRVVASRGYLAAFLEALKADAGDRGTIAIEFGDHQSEATMPYLQQLLGGESLYSDFRSLTYRTYVAVHGFGAKLDATVFDEAIDIGYLAPTLIEAANLPTSPMFRHLSEVRKACGGRYHTCEQRELVDAHLKMRADSGMLVLD